MILKYIASLTLITMELSVVIHNANLYNILPTYSYYIFKSWKRVYTLSRDHVVLRWIMTLPRHLYFYFRYHVSLPELQISAGSWQWIMYLLCLTLVISVRLVAVVLISSVSYHMKQITIQQMNSRAHQNAIDKFVINLFNGMHFTGPVLFI